MQYSKYIIDINRTGQNSDNPRDDAMQYEFPKCPICGSNKGYEVSGVVGKYYKCLGCMAKWRLYVENQNIASMAMHELPKNGMALCNVANANAPLFLYIGQPLQTKFWKNLNLTGKIDWEYLSRKIDSSITGSIVIENGEKTLYGWSGNRIIKGSQRVQGRTVPTAAAQLGALLLTTRRLIWLERRQTGIWKPVISHQIAHETYLENIKGIAGDTGDSNSWLMPKTISIVDNSGENTFNLQHAFLELVKPMIENAITTRREEIDSEKKKDRVHLMLDFSFLKTYMEKGGLVMQVLKCPECGAGAEFPKTGNETECDHCGKKIYAQDIFEKIKGLI